MNNQGDESVRLKQGMGHNIESPQDLLEKIEKVKKENPLDLTQGEDLAIGVMNLISLEEHLFFTVEKTGQEKYLDLLNTIRALRIETYRRLITNPEGEAWCIGKHLLAASMRFMEVGTKSLKMGNRRDAKTWFDESFRLFGLFFSLLEKDSHLSHSGTSQKNTNPKADLSGWVKQALNCCKE